MRGLKSIANLFYKSPSFKSSHAIKSNLIHLVFQEICNVEFKFHASKFLRMLKAKHDMIENTC